MNNNILLAFVFYVALAFLTGCESDDGGGAPADDSNQGTNTVVLISGAPGQSAIEGFPYEFQPTLTEAGLALTAENLPSWLGFDNSSGRLSGTPDASGSFSNIKIVATRDGGETIIGPFTIVVTGDPLAQFAWHLNNTGQTTFADNAASSGSDMNVFGLIQTGLTGKGVKIAVSDTGLEIAHEDLSANVLSGQSRNYHLSAPFIGDPTPSGSDSEAAHGTAVAGISAAVARNGKGSRGIAPEASLAGFIFIGTNTTDAKFVDQAEGSFDIFNYSYGTSQCVYVPVTSTYYDQLEHGVTNLRDGKGAIYVKSAGNDRINTLTNCNSGLSGFFYFGNSNLDGKNTTPFTIIAGAVNANGKVSSYSSPGSNVWVSSPGGEFGDDDPAILTTDLSTCSKGMSKSSSTTNSFEDGDDLNLDCNYTSAMNGTSSAAPALSGVIALMLEANPDLTWRDVKNILASTATTVQTFDNSHPLGANLSGHDYGNSTITNDAGFTFSNQFGFGMVNAKAAVEEALNYNQSLPDFVDTISKNSGDSFYKRSSLNQSIPDNNSTGTSSTLTVRHRLVIEAIRIKLSVTHTFSGDLGVKLVSPSGTTSTLLNVNSNLLEANLTNMALLSNAFFGESSFGTWTLQVVDGAAQDVGTLDSWSIEVFGHAQPAPGATPPPPVTNLTVTQNHLANGAQITGTWNHGTGDFNRYEFSIGSSEGASDIYEWEAVGTSTTGVASELSLTENSEIFFNVRTIGSQEVNVSTESVSMTVDSTPPALPTFSNFPTGVLVRDTTLSLTGTCEPGANLTVLFANDALSLTSSSCGNDGVLTIVFEILQTGTRTFTVVLEDSAGNSSQQTFGFIFTDEPPLSITSIEPNSGTGEGGDRITITGTGFGPALPQVSIFSIAGFGNCTDVAFISSTQIECTTPVTFAVFGVAPTGAKDVRIESAFNEEFTLEDGFTYLAPWTSTSSENVLEGRIRGVHAQIGSEVFVWGGMTPPNGDSNGDGAIYDFETGNWAAVSNTNAPSARKDASIVSTGSKYIIWGGFGQAEGTHLSDGYVYDPTNDSWTAISNTGAPSARSFHGAVWTGSEMIVWGGQGDSGFLGDGASYNPTTNSWSPIASAPLGHEKIPGTVVWTGSKMLTWGGNNGSAVDSGALYDPQSDSWSEVTTTNSPSPREDFGATWTGSKLFVWGGRDDSDDLRNGALYNPSNDSWTTLPDIGLEKRSGLSAQLCDDKVIFWGGTSPVNSNNYGASFDLNENKMRLIAFVDDPDFRKGHISACHENKMFVWGGDLDESVSGESPIGGIYLIPTEI